MLTLAPSLFAILACSDGGLRGNDDDTGSTTADSGTLDTDANYEEGCLLVDGAGGYKYLADALKVADEGSVVTLCEGTLVEHVTITRSVTISAPAGADPTTVIWSAPVNEIAAEISGAVGVTLSGFTLESTRSGIQIDSAADVAITDVTFASIEGTAVIANDTADLLIDGCTFSAPQLGGVEIDGGTAEISNALFDYPLGFAVKARGGATVGLSDSVVTGTFYTELNADGQFSDGFAFWGTQDATLLSTNNVYNDNLSGLWADEANIDSVGDEIIGGLYGAYCVLGSCAFTGGTFTDNLAYGIIAANQGDGVQISDTTISGDPEIVYNDGVNGLSVGLLVQADGEVSLTDLAIDGHNYVGALLRPWNGGLDATLTRVALNNNGRNGLYMLELDATLEDVTVDGLREVDPGIVYGTNGSATIQHGFGVSVFGGSNVVWTGGGSRDSELINVLNLQSTLYMDGVELAGGTYFSLWNIEGDLTFTNGSVTRAPYRGGIMSQYGAAVTLTGNTFYDNLETYHWIYDVYGDGTYVYDYYYYDYSTDFSSYLDGPINISGNTFTNGSTGLEIYSNNADAVVSDNSWTGYNQQAIYVSSQSSSNPVTIENNTFTDIGAYAIYCTYGAARLKDITIDGVTGYRSAADYYINGEFSYGWDDTNYQAAIYSTSCELELDTVSVANSADHAIQLRNSTLTLLDVAVSGGSDQGYSSEGSLMLTWDSSTPELLASGITVSDNAIGAGLMIRGNTSYPGGTVRLSDVTVSGSAAEGVWLSTLPGVVAELDDVSITGSGGVGLDVDGADLLLDTATISNNAGVGASLRGTAVASITTELIDASLFDNGGDGLDLGWATTTLNGTSLASNLGYGMVCADGVALAGCDDTDLDSNGEGPHCGCHDHCSVLPGPLCEDQPEPDPDTGGDTGGDSGGDTGL